jgi:hypothetical protein
LLEQAEITPSIRSEQATSTVSAEPSTIDTANGAGLQQEHQESGDTPNGADLEQEHQESDDTPNGADLEQGGE